MATTINTNVAAIRTQNVYNRNNTEMNAAMTRVATAQKINSAKDNSSVWAITEKMRERIRANDQANQNIQNDSALLRTAQDGMGNTLSILTTLKERAINAANDSNISSDRSKIVEEVRQLTMQIDDNAAKVKFNGRALLNGAQESDSGKVNNTISGTVSAEAVTATGKYGNMAVYGITGLQTTAGAVSANSALLTALVGDNGERLFQEGDTITLRWSDNGVAKEANIGVSSTSKVSDLTTSNGLTGTWVEAGGSVGSATDDSATPVAVKAGAAGMYLTGAANHNISDLSISVTSDAGITRTAAQEVLKPTAIQQSYGDDKRGSNEVYQVTATATTKGDSVKFYELGTATKDLATTTYTLKINDQTIKFEGSTTLSDLNGILKQSGLNVEVHYAAAGDSLTYEGNTVTKGTYGSTAAYKATAGLHFVAGSDQEISFISLGGSPSGGKWADVHSTTDDTNTISQKLALDNTGTGGTTSTSSSLLPQGQPLQFFVGGEQNFGVNFTIGKATVGNLFGGSVDTFASKFQTKEGAESALSMIDNAISKVLTEQTRLGAMEARLGYTSDNIISMNENLEAGYSAYRDADIAKEMTNYMKYAVLSQASQYMLSQAGQNAFQTLNLLQQ